MAHKLFLGGVDCIPESNFDFQAALRRTQNEIEKGTKVLYEAVFQFNGVLAALDILVKTMTDGELWITIKGMQILLLA